MRGVLTRAYERVAAVFSYTVPTCRTLYVRASSVMDTKYVGPGESTLNKFLNRGLPTMAQGGNEARLRASVGHRKTDSLAAPQDTTGTCCATSATPGVSVLLYGAMMTCTPRAMRAVAARVSPPSVDVASSTNTSKPTVLLARAGCVVAPTWKPPGGEATSASSQSVAAPHMFKP
jgi:hypothetical protein